MSVLLALRSDAGSNVELGFTLMYVCVFWRGIHVCMYAQVRINYMCFVWVYQYDACMIDVGVTEYLDVSIRDVY